MPEDHDISVAMATLLDKADPARRVVSRVPNVIVAADDDMYTGDDGQYVNTGYSALNLIIQSLESVRKNKSHVGAVLDYGCGFGRVTRWLRAAFLKAKLYAADPSPSALASVSESLGVDTLQLDEDLGTPLPDRYDLIWIGSFLTHLRDEHTARLLRFLLAGLSDDGIIVATTHGDYVARRIASRQKTYGIADDAIPAFVQSYRETGSAFATYADRDDAGVSAIRADKMIELAHNAGLETTYFRQQGWALHQDGFCFRPASAT